jgi:hypothetical protein
MNFVEISISAGMLAAQAPYRDRRSCTCPPAIASPCRRRCGSIRAR